VHLLPASEAPMHARIVCAVEAHGPRTRGDMPAEVLAAFGLRDGNRRRGHHRRYDSTTTMSFRPTSMTASTSKSRAHCHNLVDRHGRASWPDRT
jgi:hypothetical protein